MLLELEKYINKDKYMSEWRMQAYKKLMFLGLNDSDILFVLQGHVDHPVTCREWCAKYSYPFIKVWEIVK